MDKKTITGMLLMLAVFYIFMEFVWKPKPNVAPATQDTPEAVEPAATKTTPAQDSLKALADTLFKPAPQQHSVPLKNQYMEVTFSNVGATITQVKLLKYDIRKDEPVNLVPKDGNLAGLQIFQGAVQHDLRDKYYNYTLAPDNRSVEFWLGDPDNPVIKRRYSLDNQYGIIADISIRNMGNVNGVEFDLTDGIADSETYTKYKNQDYKFLLDANNELKKTPLASLLKKPPAGQVNTFKWAALRSKYFAIAVAQKDAVTMRKYEVLINNETGNHGMILDSSQREAKASWDQSLLIFAGPAEYDLLKTYGNGMENIAERGPGWVRGLANIIAGFLKFLFGIIHNYGVVIIIFSLILSVILTTIQHPLTRRGMEANMKMQMLQPQIEEIKKRFPNKPREQQIEISKLYKETGVNPFGGCITFLPILLQLPILITLYNVLRYTIDMRNAGFVFWYKDLSLPDKTMILPILMGATMVLQSRIMKPPSPPADQMTEQQIQAQKMGKTMNWVMPVLMFFIFRGLPAGLVLYYTVYSIFSAIQNYHMQKKIRNKGI
jgi:YidC/Oxa1 family membrane protein insertase